MHDSASWKTEETIVGLPPLLVLSAFSRFGGCHLSPLRFQVTLDGAINGTQTPTSSGWLDREIRTKHGFASFQQADKIADAIRLISSVHLWNEVSTRLGIPVVDIKNRLQLIVDRRNKIAHEADIDPSFPGSRWPITSADATGATDFVERVCETIHFGGVRGEPVLVRIPHFIRTMTGRAKDARERPAHFSRSLSE
jgi:hypothetical protein